MSEKSNQIEKQLAAALGSETNDESIRRNYWEQLLLSGSQNLSESHKQASESMIREAKIAADKLSKAEETILKLSEKSFSPIIVGLPKLFKDGAEEPYPGFITKTFFHDESRKNIIMDIRVEIFDKNKYPDSPNTSLNIVFDNNDTASNWREKFKNEKIEMVSSGTQVCAFASFFLFEKALKLLQTAKVISESNSQNLLSKIKTFLTDRKILSEPKSDIEQKTRGEEEDILYARELLKGIHIDLGSLEINDKCLSEECQHIAGLLASEERTYFSKLRLDSCVIDFEKEGKLILESIQKRRTPIIIEIVRCNIGDNGAIALAETLKACSCITILSITNNKIGNVGAIAIANSLKQNKSLSLLDLSFNGGINNLAAISFIEVLNVNSTLTDLGVTFCIINSENRQALDKCTKRNQQSKIQPLQTQLKL